MATVNRTLGDVAGALRHLAAQDFSPVLAQLGWLRSHHARLFVIGNGGGAGFAMHAASDFRKIAGIDAYACDNVCEITARINDDGWGESLKDWMRFAAPGDGLLVFSVGGGSEDVSANLVRAIEAADAKPMRIIGIVGQGGGFLAEHADALVRIPSDSTPIVEACQAALWHALVEALR